MPPIKRPILFFLLLIPGYLIAQEVKPGNALQQSNKNLRILADLPYLNKEEQLVQAVYYTSDSNFKGQMQICYYKYNSSTDSVLIYSRKNIKCAFRTGLNTKLIDFRETDSNAFREEKYYNILKNTGQAAAGTYRVFLRVFMAKDSFSFDYIHDVDSNLAPGTSLYQDINSTWQPKSKKFLGIDLGKNMRSISSSGNAKALEKMNKHTERVLKSKGLRPVPYKMNGKTYTNLFYNDWFVCKYEEKKDAPLRRSSRKANSLKLDTNAPDAEDNDRAHHQSAFANMRSLKKKNDDNKELKGEISLATNISSGQEQYSTLDNNYYELSGRFAVPVMGMPTDFEGFYTSQDAHRLVKSSYFRMHYDVESAKSALTASINSYKNKVSENEAKGIGMEQAYKGYITGLERQRSQLISEAEHEKNNAARGTKELQNQKIETNTNTNPTAAPDSTNQLANAKSDEKKLSDSVASKEKEAQERYNRIKELDRKIEKLKKLLAQNKNTQYFDSSLSNGKLKNLDHVDDMTYKQLAKKADNLLPEGKSKSFLSGITHFDAGMFPKYESKYTMSGQMMKGADGGYDFGLCKAGFTLGSTQYVGRDGNIDKYTCYSGSVNFSPAKGEKVGFVYYGYTPSQKMFSSDPFFKNVDLAAPSFRSPVHILSINYGGAISRYVSVNAEAAKSITPADSETTKQKIISDGENMAYNVSFTGNIPNTGISLESSYDKTGRSFQNNTLPVSLAGTEQYKVASRGDFFRSFLSLGVEYDFLRQNNFSSSGNSSKWGFDIATHSKRYPSLSLSYKPFTTFRSITDTLNIPQHPLLGSVFTSRAVYQFKKSDMSWRFTVLYTKSSSTMDTIKYGSTLLQFSCIYNWQKLMLNVSAGRTEMYSSIPPINTALTGGSITLPGNTNFFSVNGSYMLSKQVNVNGGQEVGFAPFGLSKYSMNVGMMYLFNKLPLTMRLNMRYSTYEMQEGQAWQKIYSGYMDVIWNFKTKLSKKSNY